ALFAQTDTAQNVILREATVTAGQEQTLGLGKLRAVEGVIVYEGKKSEVVSLRDITANLATNNPRQVFSRVAGLNIWESDGAGLQLGIGGRGLSPNRTSNFNTRQNGYDISADALGYPESYYTPPTESLQRIEVVRGAASLQYGTQFGGMLNFVMHQPVEGQPFRFHSRQTAGAWGFFGSYNAVSGSIGQVSYYGFYQHKRGKGWRPNAAFELNNGYLDLHWHAGDRFEMGIELTKMSYLAQQPGGLTDTQFEQNPRQSLRTRNWFRVDWNLACLHAEFKLSDRTRLSNRAFGLLASRQSLGNLSPANNLDFGQNRDLISGTFDNVGNETRVLHRYKMGKFDNALAFGGRVYRGFTTARQGEGNNGNGPEFQFLNPDNVEKSDFSFPNYNYAAFAENIFWISPQFSLTPGLRFENIQTFADGYYQQRVYDFAGNLIAENREQETLSRRRSFVLFGLGASWKASKMLELYANISQNYRAINFTDLRIDNPNGRVDPNIRDERGYTADLGLRTRRNSWWYADVTAFYLSYKDRIGQLLKADQPPLYNDYRLRTNISDARNIGIEAFAEANLWRLIAPKDSSQRLSLFINASVIDARYVNTDDASIRNRWVELVPPVTFRTGLSWTRGSFRSSFNWAFTAEHFTDATNARRTASAVNGIIPAYAVADLSLAWAWKWLSIEASCNNLFDAHYFTRRADAYPGPGIIPADGRGWYVTLGVQL
ncbi:MAG: TonB-dependent receptor, partial [Saprospiraceae bacterium]|nr:TonB-dependent receptor [Saprospiraceae bacterium]